MSISKNNSSEDDDRAVSPVIGVILMVAITVILAAVIAAFVLDLGQSQSANPQAGFDIEETDSSIEVSLIDTTRLDHWGAYCGDRSSASLDADNYGASDWNDPTVGLTVDAAGCGGSNIQEDVTVIGVYQGEESILQ